MCGFVGYLKSDDSEPPDLTAWSESIRHRGPDQSGCATCGEFGIATCRLSIQDLSDAGSQPMQSERFILGFNGEIYNHFELRRELMAERPAHFFSTSDTETVLVAMDRWGIPDTLERLNGMYALAVWDRLTKELSLARDPLGVKPLYYLRSRDGVRFASEVKALRPCSTGQISQEGLALYLYLGFIPAPHSLLDGVSKLRPSERLIFSDAGVRSEITIPRAWKNPDLLAPTTTERVRQVRSQVEDAVERQLISDVPVGVFLSGGIDSTIIASVAAERSSDVSSFSLNPQFVDHDKGAQRDAQLARILAGDLGFEHHEVAFHPDDVVARLERFLTQIDEPVAELYALGELLLSESARAEGVKVVLTGHGADEVFLGYPTYAAVFRGDFYNKLPMFGPLARLAARNPLISDPARSNLLGAAGIWRKSPLDRYTIVSGVHFSLDQVAAHSGLPGEYILELVSKVLGDTSALVSVLPRASGDCNAELFARMDMMLKVPDHYNTRLDRMTMAASVEARVPFQDLELIGFVSQLPHEDLLKNGLKGMFREAFRDVLPFEVTNRPKQTFQAPMLSWIDGPLNPWVTQQLAQYDQNVPWPLPVSRQTQHSTGAAYQSWSLALLEGWRKSLALEF